MSEDAGIRLVGHVLHCLSEGGRPTVDELSREAGVARSTAFDVIRRLEQHGFVERGDDGRIGPGASAAALAFARFGLARLHGPAEAVLTWLRDETGGCAILSCGSDAAERILIRMEGDRYMKLGGQAVREPIRDTRGVLWATISLELASDADESDVEYARLCACKAAVTLVERLESKEG